MTDDYYNTDNFPHFVGRHGNWNLYANKDGYCASIPTKEAEEIGCRASHFGDSRYVKITLGISVYFPTDSAATKQSKEG